MNTNPFLLMPNINSIGNVVESEREAEQFLSTPIDTTFSSDEDHHDLDDVFLAGYDPYD